jgi:cell division protein FtsL
MAQRSSYQSHSHSDNSLIRSATSYRESDGSGLVSGIMATRSVDSDDDDNNNYAELSVNSDLQNNPQMISGRGALISGMSVPSFDSEEEIEFEGGLADLESGFEPPDSDYASRAPPQLFPKTTYERNEVNLMTMDAASDLSGKSESRTEKTEGPPELHIEDLSLNIGKPRRRKVFWYTFIFITLLMIGSVIAVAIVLANKEKLTPVQQEISDIVTTISGQDVVANKYSPQRKAYTWMVHEDKMFADKTVPLNRDAVVQRYVLAVFYFATNGQLWIDNNWLKGGECSDMWTGLKCNNQDQVLAISLGTQL